jgi:hypothetical protein
MAHYASNLDSSPAVAPSSVPLGLSSKAGSQHQGSHLTLPDLRSTSPLLSSDPHSRPTVTEPIEIELASETHSQSSASSVTYSCPTTNPFKTGTTGLATPVDTTSSTGRGEASEAAHERPAWAEEGLGSTDLSPISAISATSAPAIGAYHGDGRSTPLPPGAAPPARGTEATRSETQ